MLSLYKNDEVISMDYITTYKKIHFTPLSPNPNDILIEDIAHALSLMCRANGHFPTFHSVAQHCIECCNEAKARGLSDRIALACLLHDASEAYLADITRPVKKSLPNYKQIEDHLLEVIFKKYLGTLTNIEKSYVKEIDNTLLYYEFYHFMDEELLEKSKITSSPDFSERSFKEVENEYLKLFHSFHIEEPVIEGVLFDMDGVLLDSEKLYTRFWREACIFYGYPMTMEQALGMRSLNHTLGQKQLELYFGEGVPYPDIRTKRIELMDNYIKEHGVEAKPGVKNLLKFLKEHHIKTSVATSSPYHRAIDCLSFVHLDQYFDAIVCGDMVKHGKPEPDIYLTAAKSLNLKPAHCIAVEDSATGLLAAKRAGCYPVMVPDLDQPSEETNQLLFEKSDRIDDIISLLKNLLS